MSDRAARAMFKRSASVVESLSAGFLMMLSMLSTSDMAPIRAGRFEILWVCPNMWSTSLTVSLFGSDSSPDTYPAAIPSRL